MRGGRIGILAVVCCIFCAHSSLIGSKSRKREENVQNTGVHIVSSATALRGFSFQSHPLSRAQMQAMDVLRGA